MHSAPLEELTSVFYLVKESFVYKKDFGLESWDMPPPGYDGQQFLYDDCDGFCLACRTLLRRKGIDSRLVYCEVPIPGRLVGSAGHLVLEVDGWILDVLQDKVTSNSLLQRDYEFLRISGYEPGDPWREIQHPIN